MLRVQHWAQGCNLQARTKPDYRLNLQIHGVEIMGVYHIMHTASHITVFRTYCSCVVAGVWFKKYFLVSCTRWQSTRLYDTVQPKKGKVIHSQHSDRYQSLELNANTHYSRSRTKKFHNDSEMRT